MAAKNTVIYCDRCVDEIISRDDLVTTFQFPILVGAYHTRCYGEEAKKGGTARIPLNSPYMTGLIVVASLSCLAGFVFYAPSPIWFFIAAIAPASRFLSWWLVERHITQS